MSPKLKLSCCTSALVELRSFLQRSLEAYGFSEVDRHQVTLAVEEVCTNLIIHSHASNPKEVIYLEVKELEKKLAIEITDKGDAFNLLEYEVPDLKKVIDGYLETRPFKSEHLLIKKSGVPFKTRDIQLMLNKILNKNVSVTMLRSIYLSSKYGEVMEEMKDDATSMGTSTNVIQTNYVKH
jgi:serine/threonine-protein kinase RsbW